MDAKFANAVFRELRRLGHHVERRKRHALCRRALVDGLPTWLEPSHARPDEVRYGIYAFSFNDYTFHGTDPVLLAGALSDRLGPILREWKPYAASWARFRENESIARRLYDEFAGEGASIRREQAAVDHLPRLSAGFDFDDFIFTAPGLTPPQVRLLRDVARSFGGHVKTDVTKGWERNTKYLWVGRLTEPQAREMLDRATKLGLFSRHPSARRRDST